MYLLIHDTVEEERGHSAFDVDRTNAGSSFYAYYNVVCCVCGTGMLGLSTSLGKGGWGALALLLLSWWMAIASVKDHCELLSRRR